MGVGKKKQVESSASLFDLKPLTVTAAVPLDQRHKGADGKVNEYQHHEKTVAKVTVPVRRIYEDVPIGGAQADKD